MENKDMQNIRILDKNLPKEVYKAISGLMKYIEKSGDDFLKKKSAAQNKNKQV